MKLYPHNASMLYVPWGNSYTHKIWLKFMNLFLSCIQVWELEQFQVQNHIKTHRRKHKFLQMCYWSLSKHKCVFPAGNPVHHMCWYLQCKTFDANIVFFTSVWGVPLRLYWPNMDKWVTSHHVNPRGSLHCVGRPSNCSAAGFPETRGLNKEFM